jgi:hypothetical protein
MIHGVGKKKESFFYFDDYVSDTDWEKLHADISYGIGKSLWHKKFVSSGVHEKWSHCEITPYMRDAVSNLSQYEMEYYNSCSTIDEKIKYITALKYIPHPFWVIFIRNNIRIESTGLINKSKSSDCHWTESASNFKSLVDLIEKLPFESIGRVMLFMTEANNHTVPHYDGRYQNDRPHDDFIWFTTKPNTKKIYIMDSETLEKHYPNPDKKLLWFNEMDYHGTESVNHFSFSIRIDGVFNTKVKDAMMG